MIAPRMAVASGRLMLSPPCANGFVFEHSNVGAFQWAVERAAGLYARKDQWTKIIKACIAQDFSWGRSAALYRDLYKSLTGNGNGKGKKKA